jgi:hypothetical protein
MGFRDYSMSAEPSQDELDRVRERFPTCDRILRTAAYDGTAAQAEIWQMFRDLAGAERLRASIDNEIFLWRGHSNPTSAGFALRMEQLLASRVSLPLEEK